MFIHTKLHTQNNKQTFETRTSSSRTPYLPKKILYSWACDERHQQSLTTRSRRILSAEASYYTCKHFQRMRCYSPQVCLLSARLSGGDLPIDTPCMLGTTVVVGVRVIESCTHLAAHARRGLCGGSSSLRGLHWPPAPSSTHAHHGLERIVDPPLETYVRNKRNKSASFQNLKLLSIVAVWIVHRQKKSKKFRGSELPRVLFAINM